MCARGIVPRSRLAGIATALVYDDTTARLIQRLKFEGRRDGLELLVAWLAARIGSLRANALVPIPRHWRRIREQGCDPTFELARALARQADLPLQARALSRARHVPPQTDLPRSERLRNVRGSFRAAPGTLRGRRVLLLDDVTTTGATLREAARELRARSGARSVRPVALAATPAL